MQPKKRHGIRRQHANVAGLGPYAASWGEAALWRDLCQQAPERSEIRLLQHARRCLHDSKRSLPQAQLPILVISPAGCDRVMARLNCAEKAHNQGCNHDGVILKPGHTCILDQALGAETGRHMRPDNAC